MFEELKGEWSCEVIISLHASSTFQFRTGLPSGVIAHFSSEHKETDKRRATLYVSLHTNVQLHVLSNRTLDAGIQFADTTKIVTENPPSTRHDCNCGLPASLQICSKLQYASGACGGFIKASDRQRIDNFIRRSLKSGFCPADLQSFGGLCETAEEKLLNQVLYFCTMYYMFSVASQGLVSPGAAIDGCHPIFS